MFVFSYLWRESKGPGGSRRPKRPTKILLADLALFPRALRGQHEEAVVAPPRRPRGVLPSQRGVLPRLARAPVLPYLAFDSVGVPTNRLGRRRQVDLVHHQVLGLLPSQNRGDHLPNILLRPSFEARPSHGLQVVGLDAFGRPDELNEVGDVLLGPRPLRLRHDVGRVRATEPPGASLAPTPSPGPWNSLSRASGLALGVFIRRPLLSVNISGKVVTNQNVF